MISVADSLCSAFSLSGSFDSDAYHFITSPGKEWSYSECSQVTRHLVLFPLVPVHLVSTGSAYSCRIMNNHSHVDFYNNYMKITSNTSPRRILFSSQFLQVKKKMHVELPTVPKFSIKSLHLLELPPPHLVILSIVLIYLLKL